MAATPPPPPPPPPPAAAALSMKLLVDTRAHRVVYAEAGKEVIDFLFSLLALPLSAVTNLLSTNGCATIGPPLDQQRLSVPAVPKNLPTTTTAGAMVGSVGNLYRSLETLDAGGHVCCRAATKNALLNPATTILHLTAAAPAPATSPPGKKAPKPKPDGAGKKNLKLFRCKGCSCSARCYDYATRVSGTPCPVCRRQMTTEVRLVEVEPGGGGGAAAKAKAADAEGSSGGGGYVRDSVTYTVLDDLSIAPISTITAVTALVSLGVTDISGLVAKDVEIGYKEGLALLKASLQSQTVLTDVFLGSNSKVKTEC